MAINTLELPTWDPIKLFHFSWIKGMFHIIILFTWICHFILFHILWFILLFPFYFAMKTSLFVLILLPFWVNFRYCKYPVALHERLLGWIPISCRCLLWNEQASEDGLWNLIWSPGGFCFVVWLIFACSLSSQTRLFHQSSSFYWLCHRSLFHSLPSSFTSISPSLLPSFTLLPAPKASNSMVKYPGQCVALQRDSGSRYAGNGPGSKWRVIVARCGYTSYRPQ